MPFDWDPLELHVSVNRDDHDLYVTGLGESVNTDPLNWWIFIGISIGQRLPPGEWVYLGSCNGGDFHVFTRKE